MQTDPNSCRVYAHSSLIGTAAAEVGLPPEWLACSLSLNTMLLRSHENPTEIQGYG